MPEYKFFEDFLNHAMESCDPPVEDYLSYLLLIAIRQVRMIVILFGSVQTSSLNKIHVCSTGKVNKLI